MKFLGVDLGSNSLGWAIRNSELEGNQFEDAGVITFDKGVASEKGNEFPKVQKRTESRSKRRNYQAEKYRKYKVLEFLIKKNMCPLTMEELNDWKRYSKGRKREYPQAQKFLEWLRFDFDGDGFADFHLLELDEHANLFAFRAFAADENFKKVYSDNPQILGRVFYQLAQRRGFKGRDEAEAKTIMEGSKKNDTKGRNEIEDYLAQYETLGSALYHYQKENGERIRQRYNLRKDYEAELKAICDLHHISVEDYKTLWKAIIWQRPLRTQKGLVGQCIYEKNKKRVQVSHPLYEEYRTWTFINNLNILPPKDWDEREYLEEKIYPVFYRSSPDFELSVIDKQLKKDGAKRMSAHHPKTKVVSARLLNIYKEFFGEDWKTVLRWDISGNRDGQPRKREEKFYDYEDIWHILATFDGQENLKNFAKEKLNFNEEKALKFSKIKLQQGYATLSLSAIRKILPYLHRGFIYSHAVYLANMPKILGEKQVNNTLVQHLSEEIGKIINANSLERINVFIINNLISKKLNDEYRYQIEDDRPLDESEKSEVSQEIVSVYGDITWRDFSEEEKQKIVTEIESKYLEFLQRPIREKRNHFIKPLRIHDQIFSFLQETYGVSEDAKKYLWHPSEQENYAAAEVFREYKICGSKYYLNDAEINKFLLKNPEAEWTGREIKLLGKPEPLSKGLKNPMALKSLYKLKKLINYLLQTGKIDEDTKVIVEIARELNDRNTRKAIENWQKERENENERYRNIIDEINKECGTSFNRDDKTLLQKVRLWEEQGRMCMYTGKMIKSCDLFNGVKYDIEHTIPASISFDNELKNLTIADVGYNRQVKKKQFPAQLPNYLSEENLNGTRCTSIIKNIEMIFGERRVEYKQKNGKEEKIVTWQKIEDLQKQYDEWKTKASYATTKEIKDNCIVRCHMIKMDLDYLRNKLSTFTIEEYKASWRNNQLRDTQIITKYALPYLKTVFRKVSVEKGSVTSKFKKVYKIKDESKKDRSKHTHHAEDAMTLTLIPDAFNRERIIKLYNAEIDKKTGKTYHEQPIGWPDFSNKHIEEITKGILINNLPDNRTIIQTYKTVRKKGKIDKDENGNKRISRGDTIRGQLHGETLYGAIQEKVTGKNGNVEEVINVVVRRPLQFKENPASAGFKNLEELEKVIVDRALFEMIKKQVETTDFKTALSQGVYAINKNGEKVGEPIRRVRCRTNIKYETIQKIHKHSFASKYNHKKFTLAENGENSLCLLYNSSKGRGMKILTILDLAELKTKNLQSIAAEPEFQHLKIGKGKNKEIVPLYAILKNGDKVIFYDQSIEELRDFTKEDLSGRMFKIYQFEKDGRIKFRHHLAAGIDTELKKENPEYSYFSIGEKPMFLRLSKAQWNFAVEGKDFEMGLDGQINFKF